jgi:hypothetical protein
MVTLDLPGNVAEYKDGDNVDDDPGQVHLAVPTAPQMMPGKSATKRRVSPVYTVRRERLITEKDGCIERHLNLILVYPGA